MGVGPVPFGWPQRAVTPMTNLDIEAEFNIPDPLKKRITNGNRMNGFPWPKQYQAVEQAEGLLDPGQFTRASVVPLDDGFVPVGQLPKSFRRSHSEPPISMLNHDTIAWWKREDIVPYFVHGHHRDYERGLDPDGGIVVVLADGSLR